MSRHEMRNGQYMLPYARTISTLRASELLRCGQTTVRNMLQSGELRGYQLRPRCKKSPWLVYLWSVEKHIGCLVDEYALDDAEVIKHSAHAARDTAGTQAKRAR